MKYLALLLLPIMFSACTTTQVGNVINSPLVQQLLTQIEQMAIQWAQNYISTHLLATRKGSPDSEKGIAELKTVIMTQYGVCEKVAELEARSAFSKAQ